MATLAAVQDVVIEVLKDVSRRPIDPAPDSDLIANLGFDSLQVIETISELENRFDIIIPMDPVAATRTVAQISERVCQLVASRQRT